VIVLACAATGSKADPWKAYVFAAGRDVPAIQTRQVHVINDELLNTPGPPLVEGARALAKIFHPENRMRERA